MEWVNILVSVLAGLAVVIGFPIALRKRKKEGFQKVEQLLAHLREMGVKASLVGEGGGEEKVGVGRSLGQRSEGTIRIIEKNPDYINVISVSSQYGVNYYLDYLVNSPAWPGKKRKKAWLARKRSSGVWGRVVGMEWRGDVYLSRELNLDYRLKDTLLQIEPDELKGGIRIFPEPRHEYARVRVSYSLPSSDLLEAINNIAGHIKVGW